MIPKEEENKERSKLLNG